MRRGRVATPRGRIGAVLGGRVAAWTGFAAVHAGLIAVGLHVPGSVFHDVSAVYLDWVQRAVDGAGVVGIDLPWVYPILAIVPIGIAFAFGPEHYLATWFALVIALDTAAFAVLLGRRRLSPTRRVAAWWWLGLLALLGPVALGRLDAITAPVAIVALLLAARHARVAALLLTIGAWIKVWPAALGLALVTASRRRLEVVLVALAGSAAVIVASLVAGGAGAVLGFLGEQDARGLQVEAPAAVPWLWAIALGSTASKVAYDHEILTFQVSGPGTDVVAGLLTPLMAVALAAVVAVGVVAVRRGAPFGALLPPLSLALVCVLLVCNKVGSPQFVTWLVAPVVLGLCLRPARFAVPALLVAAIAGCTQVLYPVLYDRLLAADPAFVLVLTVKVLLELAVLGWSVRAVWKSGTRRREVA
ncbi:membrane protein [Agromyces mangrovi Wang et al. 2018]|nr:membrane protein [Agromyces mangrovi]